MAKKIFKSLILGIVVFAAAILAGYLAYVATFKFQENRLINPDYVSASAQNPNITDNREIIEIDHYLARFENGDIAIYIISDGKEYFLYTLDVYAENLPDSDMEKLKEGILLYDRAALASFEEDFTS